MSPTHREKWESRKVGESQRENFPNWPSEENESEQRRELRESRGEFWSLQTGRENSPRATAVAVLSKILPTNRNRNSHKHTHWCEWKIRKNSERTATVFLALCISRGALFDWLHFWGFSPPSRNSFRISNTSNGSPLSQLWFNEFSLFRREVLRRASLLEWLSRCA